MFAIRFRTPEICEEFLKIIQNAQDELDISNNVIGDGMAYSKPGEKVESGWGEKYRPNPGSWECATCYVTNENKTDKCISCSTYRDGQKSDSSPQKFKPSPAPPVHWNEKPKPKIGTWMCKTCFIHNDGKRNYCEACDTPKNDTVPKRDTSVDLNASGQQFSFGIPFIPDSQQVATGWGDTFKPKLGSWECKACYIPNDTHVSTCIACNSPNPNKDTLSTTIDQVAASWSDKVKPQIGFWECKTCLITNGTGALDCVACNTPKEQPENKQTSSMEAAVGWGDAYKPKLGSWRCEACYITNDTNKLYCVACDSPKDASIPKKESKGIDLVVEQKFSFGIPKTASSIETDSQRSVIDSVATGWGDKFTPKTGSWECKACYINNDATAVNCIACESPKDATVPKKDLKDFQFGAEQKFKFGIPNTASSVKTDLQKSVINSVATVWGDQFTPKTGSWECKACYIMNEAKVVDCIACESPKDSSVPKKETAKSIDLGSSDHKYSFGIPKVHPIAAPTKPSSFMFGVQQTPPATTGFTFGVQSSPISITPVQSPLNLAAKSTFSFSLQSSAEPVTPAKDEFIFGSPNKHEFEFHPRSPRKTSGGEGDAESDGSGAEEECDNIYFKPVVSLPEKVEVRTGEEEELVLYCHRAKLFRFTMGEWKERGIGDIKILKHPQTAKLRVVMRREQILKICLNHCLTKEVEYTTKDERTWLFSAADYSEGEISYEQFCIRFKNAEIAHDFMTALNDAVNDTAIAPTTDDKNNPARVTGSKKETIDPDLVIVYETKVTKEEEEKALALQLPKNFYAYLQKPPCVGCIGCNPDDWVYTAKKPAEKCETPTTIFDLTSKTNSSVFGSARSSVFGGTPKSTFSTPFTFTPQTKSTSSTSPTSFSATPSTLPVFGGFGSANTSATTSTALMFGGSNLFTTPISKIDTVATMSAASPAFGASNFFGATTPISKTDTGSSAATPTFGGSNFFGVTTPISKIDTVTSSATPVFGGSTMFGGTTISKIDTAITSASFGGSNMFNTPATITKIETSVKPSIAPVFGGSNLFGAVTTTPVAKNDAPTLTALLTQPSKLTSTPPSSPNPVSNEHKSPLAPSKLATSTIFQSSPLIQASGNIFGPKGDSASIFGSRGDSPSIFGAKIDSPAIAKPVTTIFGGSPSIFSGVKSDTSKTDSSYFGKNTAEGTPAFGTPLFGGAATEKRVFASPITIFDGSSVFVTPAAPEGKNPPQIDNSAGGVVPAQISIFGGLAAQKLSAASTGSLFGSNSTPVFGKAGFASQAPEATVSSDEVAMFSNVQDGPTFASLAQTTKPKEIDLVLKCDSNLSFAALATGPAQPTFNQQAIPTEEIKPFAFAGTGALVFGGKKTEKSTTSTPNLANQSTTDVESDGEAAAAEPTEDYDPHYEPIVPLPEHIVVKTGEEDEDIMFKDRAKLYRYNVDTKEWKERGVGTLKLLFHPVNRTYRLLLRREQVHKLVLNQLVTLELDLQPLQNSDRAWLWAGYNYSEDGSQLEKLAVRFKNVELAKQFYDSIEAAKAYLSEISTEEHEDFQGNEEDASDESDESRSMMFSKRCTLSFKSNEADAWCVLGMGVLKIYYDSDLYGGRIEMYDDNGENLSNTIIAMNTIMRVEDNCCIWRSMEWNLDPAVPRILQAQFSSEPAAKEMFYNYQEAMQYAQQSDIYDTLPKET